MKKVIQISQVLFTVIVIGFSVSTLTQCGERKQTEPANRAASLAHDPLLNDSINYKLIPGINNTWGYDILVDNKVVIHQPCIPGLPGNDGFKTRESAGKVARLVISKLKKGEDLPAITEEELKELKVI